MAELADARDLKSREIFSRTGSTPASGTINIAEWSSLAARRAHNPKVMRFKSHLRNQRLTKRWAFFFCFSKNGARWDVNLTSYALWPEHSSVSAECRRDLCPPPQWRHTASFCAHDRKIADNPSLLSNPWGLVFWDRFFTLHFFSLRRGFFRRLYNSE